MRPVSSLMSHVVKEDGTVHSTGYNHHGELGDSSRTHRSNLVHVADEAKAISAGWHHTIILGHDGSVRITGYNGHGQHGDGSKTQRHTFKQTIASGVKAIAAGGYPTYILKDDGTVSTTGHGGHGELGDGTHTLRTTFKDVATGVKAVAASYHSSMLLSQDNHEGAVRTCGRNNHGQLGDKTTSNRASFITSFTDGKMQCEGSPQAN